MDLAVFFVSIKKKNKYIIIKKRKKKKWNVYMCARNSIDIAMENKRLQEEKSSNGNATQSTVETDKQ